MKYPIIASLTLLSFAAPASPGYSQEIDVGLDAPVDWKVHHRAHVYIGCSGWIGSMPAFRDILSNDCCSGLDDQGAQTESEIWEINFVSYDRNTPPLELRHLESFPNLRMLAIFDGRRLGDSAWGDIAKKKDLIALIAPTAKMKDEDLSILQGLEELRILDISMSDITDASIETLSTFRNLRALNISGTQMTLRGGEKLRGMLPRCWVSFYPPIYGPRSQSNWAPYMRELDRENEDDDK